MTQSTIHRLWTRRVAGVLICLVFGSAFGFRGAQGAHRARLSVDLLAHEGHRTIQRKRVIVHGTPDDVQSIAERHHLSIVRLLGNGAVLSVDSAELTDLASDSLVDHISPDARVHLMLTVSNTSTSATQVRTGTKGLLGLVGAYPGVTGKGVGVAVLDSGISPHLALKNVVASVNFVTGSTATSDEFGHGTHVAGIIGGAPTAVTSLYGGGIAPDANIINVRVLGPDGTGSTSDVIAGMEWASPTARWHPRDQSVARTSVTEPLSRSPVRGGREATALGIVVVAAAGAREDCHRTGLAGKHCVAGGAVRPDGRGAQHVADPGTSDDCDDLQLAGPTRYRLAVEA
jgi:serine protease AprX